MLIFNFGPITPSPRAITSIPGIPTLMWKNMDKIAGKMSDGYDVCNLEVTQDKCFMDVIR